MSIRCQINPYKETEVFHHIQTKWEIATSQEFLPEQIIDTQTTTGKNLNVYESRLSVPLGKKYYLRATRIFQEDTSPEVLPITEVENYNRTYNQNLIHQQPVYVDVPFIYVNLKEFNDPEFVDFEVRTSDFRCDEDGHKATHWIVTDQDNNVLFQKLYCETKEEKTTIRLEKTEDLLNRSVFYIHAIHVTTNGIESPIGTYAFSNNNFAFDIVGIMENVTPGEAATLKIVPPTARNNLIDSVFLKIPNEDGDITKGIDVTPELGSDTITIPGDNLRYDSKYYLDVYGYNKNGEYTTKRYVMTTRKSEFIKIYNPDLKYQRALFNYPDEKYSSFNTCSNYTTFELPNKDILIPKSGSDRLTIYKAVYATDSHGAKIEIDLGEGGNGFGLVDNIILPDKRSDNILLKMMNNNLLLIDSYNPDGYPIFTICNYDRVLNTFSLGPYSLPREDEKSPLGLTNSIFQYSSSEAIYLANGTKVIKKVNFMSGRVSTEYETNNDSIGKMLRDATMFYNRMIGVAIILTKAGRIFVYDPEVKKLTESGDLPFEDWVGCIIKPVELPNGDYILINKSSSGLNPTTSPNGIVYYDSINNAYSAIPYEKGAAEVLNVGTISGYSSSLYIHNFNSQTSTNIVSRLF